MKQKSHFRPKIGATIFYRGVLLVMAFLLLCSGGVSAAGLSEPIFHHDNHEIQAAIPSESGDVASFVVSFLFDASSAHKRAPGEPTSEVCHHCHGHFTHVAEFIEIAFESLSFVDVLLPSPHYFGHPLERVRTPLFRPPIRA